MVAGNGRLKQRSGSCKSCTVHAARCRRRVLLGSVLLGGQSRKQGGETRNGETVVVVAWQLWWDEEWLLPLRNPCQPALAFLRTPAVLKPESSHPLSSFFFSFFFSYLPQPT